MTAVVWLTRWVQCRTVSKCFRSIGPSSIRLVENCLCHIAWTVYRVLLHPRAFSSTEVTSIGAFTILINFYFLKEVDVFSVHGLDCCSFKRTEYSSVVLVSNSMEVLNSIGHKGVLACCFLIVLNSTIFFGSCNRELESIFMNTSLAVTAVS